MRPPLGSKAAYFVQIVMALGLSCSAYGEHHGGGGGHAGGGGAPHAGGGAAPHMGGGQPHMGGGQQMPHSNPMPAPHMGGGQPHVNQGQMPHVNQGQMPHANPGQFPRANPAQGQPHVNQGQFPRANPAQGQQHVNQGQFPRANPAQGQHVNAGQVPHNNAGQVPHNNGGQPPHANGGQPPHNGGQPPHNNPFNPGNPAHNQNQGGVAHNPNQGNPIHNGGVNHNPNQGNPIHNGGVVHNPNNGNPIHNGGVNHNPNQGNPVRPHGPGSVVHNPVHPVNGGQHPVGPMNVAHHGGAPVWNGNQVNHHPAGVPNHPIYNRGNVTSYVGASHGVGHHGPVPNFNNAVNHVGKPSYYNQNWSQNNYKKTNNLFLNVNIQHNTTIINHVGGFWHGYGPIYSPWWSSLGHYYSGIYSTPWRYCYQPYYNYGFYGGYFYPVNPLPVVVISQQMYYPAFYWLYSSQPSTVYYQNFYGQQAVEQTPVETFAYANYLLPTDALAKLTEEVSGDAAAFAVFRERITTLIDQIQQRVNDLVGAQVPLANGGIVLNRYENLNNSAAYKVEGMVEAKVTMSDGTIKAVQFGLQGLLDMQDPQGTGVFIPSSDEPNDDDLKALQALNQRISDLGGKPNVPEIEPPLADTTAPAQP